MSESATASAPSAPRRVNIGKRTGVNVAEDEFIQVDHDGIEDLDLFFDLAKSAEKNNTNSGELPDNNILADNEFVQNNQRNENKKQKAKTQPKTKETRTVRFSIEGKSDDNEDGLQRPQQPGGRGKAIRKVLVRGGRISMSPSDLSSVSTATPLPPTTPEEEEEEEEEENNDEHEAEEEEMHADQTEDPSPGDAGDENTQPEQMDKTEINDNNEKDMAEEVAVQKQGVAAVEDNNAPQQVTIAADKTATTPATDLKTMTHGVHEDDDDLPPIGNDSDDEEDDMVPPPPPMDDEEEDESKSPDRADNANVARDDRADEDKIPTAASDDDNEPTKPDDNDAEDVADGAAFPLGDDFDEDDNEGPGFQTAHADGEDDDSDELRMQSSLRSPLRRKQKKASQAHATPILSSTKKTKQKNASSRNKRTPMQTPEADDSSSEEESSAPNPSKSKSKKTSSNISSGSKRKRKIVVDSHSGSGSDEEASAPRPKKQKKSKKAIHRFGHFTPKGIQNGPRQYTAVPVTDLRQKTDESQAHLRRSKRMRCPPLEFWKNESYEWGPNEEFKSDKYDCLLNMPVPKAVNRAEPTPYKPRKAPSNTKKKEKDGNSKNSRRGDDWGALGRFDTRKLRKKYKYLDQQEIYVWDENEETTADLKVVAFKDRIDYRDLPRSKNRPKSESKVVGKAAQAFNVTNKLSGHPGYLMGNLILPPKAIKDAESVGACAQMFTVVSCQDEALEVAYGNPDENEGDVNPNTAQRVLLHRGDMFRIPPGNCYRLENHSEEVETYLTWVIVRPLQLEEE